MSTHDESERKGDWIDNFLALRDPQKKAAFLALANTPPSRQQRRLVRYLRKMDKRYNSPDDMRYRQCLAELMHLAIFDERPAGERRARAEDLLRRLENNDPQLRRLVDSIV